MPKTPPTSSDKTIDASPTKELFISMLTRDLTLKDAIGDLVDNCVDGAKTISPNDDYKNLFIHITANPDKFIIEDNCGGFSVKTAQNYAFHFGRVKGAPSVSNSIGQFGIGMKRALFKLGKKIEVTSTFKDSHFKMKINIDEWKNEKDWKFVFTEMGEKENNAKDKCGTKITVTDLYPDVIAQFNIKNTAFHDTLNKEIALEHLFNINKGLEIKINATKLKTVPVELLYSEDIKPAYFEKEYDKKLKVKIYVGISDAVLSDGGWYIFCNERKVVGPEQTSLTGWTGKNGDGGPNYHNQFKMFRGYVFFEAKDSSYLPWNTAKNGMNLDSPIYQAVRQQMISMMEPVISFLNDVKTERGNNNQVRPQEEKIKKAVITPLSAISKKKSLPKIFNYTKQAVKKQAPTDGLISYTRSKDKIEAAKKFFKVSKNAEVGEKTFDYFYKMEME